MRTLEKVSLKRGREVASRDEFSARKSKFESSKESVPTSHLATSSY